MNYGEAIQFLYSLRLFGTKLGLENSFKLAALAGNPQEQLRFIHVAGTNGKGSTCAMLESIYRHAGLRVGLFTSPHLVSFRERIQINRQLISEADVIRLVQTEQGSLASFSPSAHPTFFEVVMVMALRYFREARCDLVIWETGLGGRLDSTNIVVPLACVITNIQLDHEKWLGSTLAEIAAEKAGIIKPHIPVITAADDPEALAVIRQTARREHALLVEVTVPDQDRPPWDTLVLPLLGEHQRLNAALAIATERVLHSQLQVGERELRTALEKVSWPGRLQRHTTANGRTILLDGAHNPAGAQSLRKALARHFPGRAPTLILGVLKDKDWAAMCQILVPVSARVLFAPVQSDRSTSTTELQQACSAILPEHQTTACSSLQAALELAESDPFVLITGSLHFVGEALERLQLLPAAVGERTLNEWDSGARGRSTAVHCPP